MFLKTFKNVTKSRFHVCRSYMSFAYTNQILNKNLQKVMLQVLGSDNFCIVSIELKQRLKLPYKYAFPSWVTRKTYVFFDATVRLARYRFT